MKNLFRNENNNNKEEENKRMTEREWTIYKY